MPRTTKKQTAQERIRAWREARVLSYAESRSTMTLAQMLVELEDATGSEPEFLFTDDWENV